jgi:hypothetical protein
MWGTFWCWLRTHEFVAIWLEGVALVAIFVLDWRERIDQHRERKEQHKETAVQLENARKQVEAAVKSAEAGIEAALASKKSADILASLHRPFMGLKMVSLRAGGLGADLWVIAFVLRNFGTLPALDVGVTIEFFAANTSFAKIKEPTSVQIFPSYETETIIQQMIARRVEIQTGAEKLRIDFRMPFRAEDGRYFEYNAQVSYNHKLNAFDIEKSETLLHYTVTTSP